MVTNEYALKFAREAYEDARRAGTVDAAELARLKSEYDRQHAALWQPILSRAS